MDAAAHRRALERDTAALAVAARDAMDSVVPSCPGWEMADLVWHTGTAVHWGVHGTRRRAGLIPEDVAISVDAPSDEELVDWFADGATELVKTLTEVDGDDQLGRDWLGMGFPGPSLARHYAREVGVHRWDAQKAVSKEAEPIDDDLGADWLDGILTTWLPRASRQGRQAQGEWLGQRIQFRRSDGDDRWLVTLDGPGSVEVARIEGNADLVVEGRGSMLLLLALNRIGVKDPSIAVEGDVELFARWAAEIRYGRPAGGAHALGSPRPRDRRRLTG